MHTDAEEVLTRGAEMSSFLPRSLLPYSCVACETTERSLNEIMSLVLRFCFCFHFFKIFLM